MELSSAIHLPAGCFVIAETSRLVANHVAAEGAGVFISFILESLEEYGGISVELKARMVVHIQNR